VIYFIQDVSVLNIKIGHTAASDASRRLSELQTGSPSGLVLLATTAGGPERERQLHAQFAAARVHGEWFRPVPDLIQFIIQTTQKRQPFPSFFHPTAPESMKLPPRHLECSRPWLLICPRCGFEYNHLPPDPVAIDADRILTIPITGECGHQWQLELRFHKGQVEVSAH